MSANLKLLQADEALAKRWLRSGRIPIAAWQWLGGRVRHTPELPLTRASAPAGLKQALAEFARPLSHAPSDSSRSGEGQCLAATLEQLANLCSWCYRHVRSSASSAYIERMLAAAVLPLYRGLATGASEEITSVMKLQLADALALAALECEFDDDLRALLIDGSDREQSPYDVVQRTLELDLSQLAETLLIACQQHSTNSTDDPSNSTGTLKPSPRPEWGQSHVLWRLAGELIANRAEFIVPRAWINVPVPWSEASDHWRAVAVALRSLEPLGTQYINESQVTNSSQPSGAISATDSVGQNSVGQNSVRQDSAGHDSSAKTSSTSTNGNTTSGSRGAVPSIDSLDEISRLKLEIEIADSVDALVQASRGATRLSPTDRGVRTDGASGLAGNRSREPEFIVPKVIIAEVRSHNDPAFVTIVRRQVALCRTEERTMSLVAIRVEPDGDEDAMPTLESLGLACWQQQLVNWIADHPEIHDPYAFVSSEGELILCLMDIERNTTTGLLRQGLIEVLTGQSLGNDSSASLSRVSTPARYHSGIGSISSPSAGFEAEQLIEATYRCLSAAQRHGKASIKSIEVF